MNAQNARLVSPSVFGALALLMVVALLQEGLIAHFTIDEVRPDFVLLLVVNWSLIRGVQEGMLCGFLGGMFVDLSSGLPFGTSSAAYVAIAGLVNVGQSALLRTHVLLPLIAAAIATAVYYVVAVVLVASIQHRFLLDGSLVQIFIGVAAYNAVVNPFIYTFSRYFDRKVNRVTRTSW